MQDLVDEVAVVTGGVSGIGKGFARLCLFVPTPASARQRRKLKDSATGPAAQQHKPKEPPTERADPPTAPLTWRSA